MISVRPARSADEPAIEDLRSEARSEVATRRGGPELLLALDRREADGIPTTLVGLIGETAVGIAHAVTVGRSMDVDELFVLAAARRVGVGTELLRSLTASAIGQGCDALAATALPGDRETKNFFESHGLTARRIIVGRTLSP